MIVNVINPSLAQAQCHNVSNNAELRWTFYVFLRPGTQRLQDSIASGRQLGPPRGGFFTKKKGTSNR